MNERDIFIAAIQMDGTQARDQFVRSACGHDQGLCLRIEALLKNYFQASDFLDKPQSFQPNAGSLTDSYEVGHRPTFGVTPSSRIGEFIGPYKLLQKIGEGGMGIVYMAQQTKPIQRTVAVKVLKPNAGRSQIIARFESERQALALMDHPNIAKVLDAGQTEAEHYFVMELVRGSPITQYCDERCLNIRERLKLVVAVCQAVQHAHQKGIIHRDLKPSNILVAEYDSTPVPKVIDFGIAKATGCRLTDRTLFTEFGQILGTIEYMSPEQAKVNQWDVDTRSDIYSLGVVLFELLAGSTPFDRKRLGSVGLEEVLRIIREEEAPAPSKKISTSETLPSIAASRHSDPVQLGRMIRGELDWVVSKCLEKERNRRYESAASLCSDIQCFLHDEPVRAGPPTLQYRLKKFLWKQRLPLSIAGMFVIVLLATSAISISLAVRAHALESAANRNASIAIQSEQRLAKVVESERKAKESEATLKETAQSQARASRLALYSARVNVAQNALSAKQFSRARQILELEIPKPAELDHRTFEWRYLMQLASPYAKELKVGHEAIMTIALSPDGRSIAIGSKDGYVTVWNLDSNSPEWSKQIGNSDVRCLGYSLDGSLLLAAWFKGDIRLLNSSTGELKHTWTQVPNGVKSLAVSPKSDTVAVGYIAGSPVELRSLHTGEVIRRFSRPYGGDTKNDSTISIYSRADGRLLKVLSGHGGAITRLAFDGSSSQLLSSSLDGTARIWDIESGSVVRQLRGHAGAVTAATYSKNMKNVITSGVDQTIKVWNKEELTPALEIDAERATRIYASPNDRKFAMLGPHAVTFWDSTGRKISNHVEGGIDGAFCSDGTRFLSVAADGATTCRDIITGLAQYSFRLPGKVSRIALHPNDRWLAVTGSDKHVRIYDLIDNVVIRELPPLANNVSSIATSLPGPPRATAKLARR